MNKNKNLP